MTSSPHVRGRGAVALLCVLAALAGCSDSNGGGHDATGTSVAGIETLGGGTGNIGDDRQATATFVQPTSVAVTAVGDVLIADGNTVIGRSLLRRMDARSGTITTVGGPCDPTQADPPVTACDLMGFAAIEQGAGDQLFVSTYDQRIFRVDARTGAVEPVAGLPAFPTCADIPDAGPRETCLDYVSDLAFDASGNLYLAEPGSGVVQRLDPSFTTLTTVAGRPDPRHCTTPSFGVDVPAAEACLHPYAIAVDGAGNLFIADITDDRIDRIDAKIGLVTTIAGGRGVQCNDPRGDGGPLADACFVSPTALALAPDGTLLVADQDRVRRIDLEHGTITTPARGDYVGSLVPASDGDVLFTTTTRVERLDVATGEVTTVAGNGTHSACGDGGPATDACLGVPSDTTLAPDGSVYFADGGNGRIGRIDARGRVTTVLDARSVGSCGDVGPRPDACLASPTAITWDTAGTLYVADRGSDDLGDDDAVPGRVRRIDARTGAVTTIAGNCTAFGSEDALTDCLLLPTSLLLDGHGGLYVGGGDGVHRIELATGRMQHVVGSRHEGDVDCHADGIDRADACVDGRGLALDAAGNLYAIGFADYRIRRIDAATGIVDTVAGNGTLDDCDAENVPATRVCMNPSALAIDGDRLFIATDGKLRVVDLQTGLIRSVAGFPASCDSLLQPDCIFAWDLEIDRAGRLVTAEAATDMIRRITLR